LDIKTGNYYNGLTTICIKELDRNKDGKISMDEWDAKRDSKISMNEWDVEFKAMDTNGDENLTSDEMKHHH